MLDFMKISTRPNKRGDVEVFPKFIVGKSSDLMIKGGDFYAIWLEDKHLWSQDEQDAINAIDRELTKFADEYREKYNVATFVQYMWDADSGLIDKWHKYCQKQMRDNYHVLDTNLVFSNQNTTKETYATKTLAYPLEEGPTNNFDELLSSLYAPSEIAKIKWGIGCVVSGDSKTVEKFLVFYGAPGSGKGTVLRVIEQLFKGYTSVFDAKSLGSSTNVFALEAFKSNPLVAIQYDGDLSKIDDNTRLNSLISHEAMSVNEKHKSLYTMNFNSFLFMGTNKPVLITDNKSGIIRRLIDVNPLNVKIPKAKYKELVNGIKFELGHIAHACKELYLNNVELYDDYIPVNMMGETNDFFNFVEDNYLIFKRENQTTLREAWEMYKTYADEADVKHRYSKMAVKAELKTYFTNYEEDTLDPETKKHIRNWYYGFKYKLFDAKMPKMASTVLEKESVEPAIDFKVQHSLLDDYCTDCPAQYASAAETPSKKWSSVKTTLKDLDTSIQHYVKVPENLIVIDFDLKDENGNKSFQKNLEEASKWPKTYAELSKSGQGIHLHYIYGGDVQQLSRIYDAEIEIKVFTGNSSLRRKLTKCNSQEIAKINSGLPLKGNAPKMESMEILKNERILRVMLKKNINKEYHSATKPSIDFIYKLLNDAYESGMKYDVTDLYNVILAFAVSSTHQSEYCVDLVTKMKFKSDDPSISIIDKESAPIVFYDCEVFPNLLLINWKKQGEGNPVVRLINPTPRDIEDLLQYRLVGFNNRYYDNHIIYARLLGKSNEEIFNLSQDIINKGKGKFGEAYNLSYTDILDYCSAANKMSLKKWEIKLGITHLELGLPWDKPVPEELWPKVAEYCDNDVISTEAVWNATQDDFTAREILADIADMTVNDTTNSLTTKIIFGNERHPALTYWDLEKEFPGYKFEKTWDDKAKKYVKKNMYRGVDLGLGGYVYGDPGIAYDVALLDVASLHPHSAIAMNAFGDYTKNYKNLVDARVHIKHKDFDGCKDMFNGKLMKYLVDVSQAKKLSFALKTAINAVYGLTSASFDNPFKHPLNENNIIALRGALFMKTLQDEVTARGFKVLHIKTDSIKIPNATKEIVDFCMDFAKKYGYTFEHEATYERICLVNNAVYIARFAMEERCKELYGYAPDECIEDGGKWTATGTQFQIPYVFKKCFTKEKIVFDDLCESKEVKTAMYLDFNENLIGDENQAIYERLEDIREKIEKGGPETKLTKVERKILDDYSNLSNEDLAMILSKYHDYRFIGKVGYFCPIKPGCGGAELVKEVSKPSGKIGMDSVTGTKGYRWKEAITVKNVCEEDIDTSYYESLANQAIETISLYGDYYQFVEVD